MTAQFWNENKNNILQKIGNDVDKLAVIKAALSSREYQGMDFYKVLGAGSYGIVFAALTTDKQRRSVKIQFEESPEYTDCNALYETYSLINSKPGVKYLIQIEEPKHLLFQVSKQNFYVCGITMERGEPADDIFFTDGETDKNRNAENMVEFLIKVMEAHHSFNVKGGFYHGDVKPANLLFIRTESGYEPRLIDFDLVFEHPSSKCDGLGFDYYRGVGKAIANNAKRVNLPSAETIRRNCNPHHIAYTITYRPPEIRVIVPTNNFAENNPTQGRTYTGRTFDAEYKEEAWSVGKEMKDIISENSSMMSPTNKKLGLIKDVISSLMDANISTRLSLGSALESVKSWRAKGKIAV